MLLLLFGNQGGVEPPPPPPQVETPVNLHPGRITGPRYLVKVGDKRFVVETEAEFRRLVAKFESNDLPKLKKQVKRIPAPVVIEAEPIQAEIPAPVDTALADRLFARIQKWNKTLERLRAEAMLRKMAQDEDEDEAALMLLL